MQIEVHEDKCIASGQCVLIAEHLFDQDDDGIVVVLNSNPSADDEAAARKAASVCPARAILARE